MDAPSMKGKHAPAARTGLRSLWAGLVAAGAVTGACAQILSIDGPIVVVDGGVAKESGLADGGGGDGCGLVAASGACQACVAAQCCGEASACARDKTCSAYETCLLGCGADYNCRSDCVGHHPSGESPAVPPMDRCIASSCWRECGVSCGLAASYGEGDSGQACLDCVSTVGCAPMRACGTSVDCLSVSDCYLGCHTSDCQQACTSSDDAGAALLQAALDGLGQCVAACDVGKHWGCVGSVAYPFNNTGVVHAAVTVVDDVHLAPLAGVLVKACDRGDFQCTVPRGMGTTDAQGLAQMTFPYAGAPYGFEGYFELTSPTIVPYLYFLPSPMVEPQIAVRSIPLSASSLATLGAAGGVAIDPTRGHLAVVSEDCWLVYAPDVTFSADVVDPKMQLRYYAGSSVSSSATATDKSGLAFFFNAPPAPQQITVAATPRSLDGGVSGRIGAFVRPGAVSVVNVQPTPPSNRVLVRIASMHQGGGHRAQRRPC